MSKKHKFYVVWNGVKPGIYSDWHDCEAQIKNFPGAKFRSFDSQAEAQAAFANGFSFVPSGLAHAVRTRRSVLSADSSGIVSIVPGTVNPPILDSIAVDAACSGNPGIMEYQGVYVATSSRLFHYKAPLGTNNIGEFLAIIHALSYQKKHGLNKTIYSDSANALSWVRQGMCKSKLPVNEKTSDLWDYVHRGELWLRSNPVSVPVVKWNTEAWGEIPADFGRK